jgi:hypothetical protein
MLDICVRVATYTEFYAGVCQRHAVSTVHVFVFRATFICFDAVCVGLRLLSISVSLGMAICRWNMWENSCLGIIRDFT